MAEVFLIAVLVFLILIPVILYRRDQRLKGNCDFDERQELLRGKAYQHAFLTVGGYTALYSMLVLFSERQFMEDGVSTLIAFFLGITVFAVECIWRDAFFTARNRPVAYVILIALNVVLQGVSGVEKLQKGLVVRNGLLTMDCVQLLCGVTFLVILLALGAKWLAVRGEERE